MDKILPPTRTASVTAQTATANEGNAGETTFTFEVKLDAVSTGSQTVKYTVAGSGANAANAADFSGSLTGSVTFAPGETSKIITVKVVGDTVTETNETFTVTLSSPSRGLILTTTTATATITNDDITGTAGVDTLTGTAANESISGLDGADIITGAGGGDLLTGGAGADTFNFNTGFGKDTITDWTDGSDKIKFDASMSLEFAELTFAGQGTGTVVISGFADGNTITVKGSGNITLDASDFLFT